MGGWVGKRGVGKDETALVSKTDGVHVRVVGGGVERASGESGDEEERIEVQATAEDWVGVRSVDRCGARRVQGKGAGGVRSVQGCGARGKEDAGPLPWEPCNAHAAPARPASRGPAEGSPGMRRLEVGTKMGQSQQGERRVQ